MTERENRQPSQPDMTRVRDGLFRHYGGMTQTLLELRPDEMRVLSPLLPDQMARAMVQALNGDVREEMREHFEKARRVRELFAESGL